MAKKDNYDAILIDMHKAGVIPAAINRIFLYGPPGTGKSFVARTIFGSENIERIAMSGKTPIEDVLGMMTLDTNGSIVWVDGPATKALRSGKVLVIDEIDQTSPAMRCTLHALLDNPAGITLPSGERVEASNGYCVIATSNESPSALAPALLDRFEMILPCIEASAGLENQLGDKGKAILQDVNKRALSDGAEKFNWCRPITPRFLLAIESLIKRGLSIEDISRYFFPHSAAQRTDFLALYAA